MWRTGLLSYTKWTTWSHLCPPFTSTALSNCEVFNLVCVHYVTFFWGWTWVVKKDGQQVSICFLNLITQNSKWITVHNYLFIYLFFSLSELLPVLQLEDIRALSDIYVITRVFSPCKYNTIINNERLFCQFFLFGFAVTQWNWAVSSPAALSPRPNGPVPLILLFRWAQYLMTVMWKSSSQSVFQLPWRNSRHHR